MAGGQAYVDIVTGAARAARTASGDLRDLGEVMLAQTEIADAAVTYFSKHKGNLLDFSEAIYHLTSAQMPRREALKLAPTIMAASVGLDAPIKETAQLAVSMNEIFKDMKGYGTDSERIARMLSVMSLAVKNEVVELDELRTSLSYVAPVAKEIGMSFEEMVGAVGLLSTNLLQGSKAGTGLRQMLNSIAKNQDKLAKLGIAFDPAKPLQFTAIMEKLSKLLGEGAIPGDTLKDLFSVFNVRGVTSASILGQQFGELVKDVRQLREASLGAVSAAATAAGGTLGIAGRVGAFMGGPLGIAGAAIGGLVALSYMRERNAAAYDDRIHKSAEAQSTYSDESARLKALSLNLAESAQLLGDNATDADMLAKANLSIAAAADKANIALEAKAGTLRKASDQLQVLSIAYANAAKLEAGLQFDALLQKHGPSKWDTTQPAWFKWLQSGAPATVQAKPALADVQNIPALLEDLKKLKEAGEAAGKSIADIQLAADAMVAGIQHRLATAAKVIREEMGRGATPDQFRYWQKDLARVESASGILADATKHLFVEQTAGADHAAAQMERYRASIAAIKADFDTFPADTMRQKLEALDAANLDPITRGKAEAKLFADELARVNRQMADLKTEATAIVPTTPEQAKEAEINLAHQKEAYQNLYHDRKAAELELAKVELNNERLIREEIEKTGKLRTEAAQKVADLQDRAGKLAREVQAESLAAFGTVMQQVQAHDAALAKSDWKQQRIDRYQQLVNEGTPHAKAVATATREVPTPLPFYIEQARRDLEARFAADAVAAIKQSPFGGIGERLARDFAPQKASRFVSALTVGPEKYYAEQGAEARRRYGAEGASQVETEKAGFAKWLASLLTMRTDSPEFLQIWQKGFAAIVARLPQMLRGATSGEGFVNALTGKAGDAEAEMVKLQTAIAEGTIAERDLATAVRELATLMAPDGGQGPLRGYRLNPPTPGENANPWFTGEQQPWLARFRAPGMNLGARLQPSSYSPAGTMPAMVPPATAQTTTVNLYVDGGKVGTFVTEAGKAIDAQGAVAEEAVDMARKSISRWTRADATRKQQDR